MKRCIHCGQTAPRITEADIKINGRYTSVHGHAAILTKVNINGVHSYVFIDPKTGHSTQWEKSMGAVVASFNGEAHPDRSSSFKLWNL